MILDGHCHAGPGPGGRDDPRFTRYLWRAREAGIERTVVFPHFHPDYRRANREVAALVARHPGRLVGFAFVHADRDRGRVRQLVREGVRELGMRGIKAHRRDAPLTAELCAAAEEFGVPLLYDPMNEVRLPARLALRYPRVSFVLPHLGSFGDDPRAQAETLELLLDLPNVFADTSAVRHFDMLERAVRAAGPSKLIFGSDGPWLHPGLELAKIRALRLSPRDERRVLGGNMLGLLRLSDQRQWPERRASRGGAGSRARSRRVAATPP